MALRRSLNWLTHPRIRIKNRVYSRETAPQLLFDRSPFRMPCEDAAENGDSPYRLQVRPALLATGRKLERFEFSRSRWRSVNLKVDGVSLVTIEGSDREDCVVRFCVEAGASTDDQVRLMLDGSTLTPMDEWLDIRIARAPEGGQCLSYVQIVVPSESPVEVAGDYASVSVLDIEGPVKVSCRMARVTILDTTDCVNAVANFLVFAGNRGQVHLEGEEIALKITSSIFHGELLANADGPVRLLVPRGFDTPFQATVKRARDFVCRADLCPRVIRSPGTEAGVFSYRQTELPTMRLASRHGTVVIDNAI